MREIRDGMRIDWDVPIPMDDDCFTGCGPFLHTDARDRPPAVFGKNVTLHCGPRRLAHLLLPIVPPPGPAERPA
ncbi:MAG TPA: hypothetical protein VGW35_16755 [Methylomirabilota bacterium]|nr:hypothetical protein [Methylomirabilota bacterium]